MQKNSLKPFEYLERISGIGSRRLTDSAPRPTFVYRDELLKGFDKLFSLFLTDDETRRVLSCSLICRNSKTLLSGGYGSGKTTFIEMAAKMFFGENVGIIRCHQELTTFDIMWNIDIEKFLHAKIGSVTPKNLITAPFKFLNEIQRLNVQCQNALLTLFADKYVHFSDAVAQTPDYVCFLDQNPHDIGTVGLVKALLDRIDYFLNIRHLGLKEIQDLLTTKYGGKHVEDLRTLIDPVLSVEQMQEIWTDVEKVSVPYEITQGSSLIAMLLRKCIRADRSVSSPRYRLVCDGCRYNGDICSQLERPAGHRWTESTIKIAKAQAWIEGRGEVTLNDFRRNLIFTLPHRLELKQRNFEKYASEYDWVIGSLGEALKVKDPIWAEALATFEAAQKGDAKALKKLSDPPDVVVVSLYEALTKPEQDKAEMLE